MCVVSMVGDHYADKWSGRPWWEQVQPHVPGSYEVKPFEGCRPTEFVDRKELDKLREEVAELRELLKRAIAYDEQNNEPHCEVEEKIDLLRKVAAMVGVDLTDLVGGKH